MMLSTPDVVWIRPRHLHRLARIPPDLRMFNSASVADVTSIDVLASYAATLLEQDDGQSEEYRLSLTAIKEGMRYPHATYRVRREDFRPVQIDFMTASGKILKTIVYAEFAGVLGRTIPTKLIVRDHVYRDSSIVRMSDFRVLSPVDPAMFTPDYLLTIPDPT
ncbi:MAG: outer membrane lipoprotein-sorting protein [Deltaproteobacteria bacterium]|nr:outer membrane lipoprotein-sorting protein [Deltaproteobacteria bacterium]